MKKTHKVKNKNDNELPDYFNICSICGIKVSDEELNFRIMSKLNTVDPICRYCSRDY